jgi:hypothetical protein
MSEVCTICVIYKVKTKFPSTCHEAKGRCGGTASPILNFGSRWRLRGQLHALAGFAAREIAPSTHGRID